MLFFFFFFFKQKTAYEMRISDWSSDVCSSDLLDLGDEGALRPAEQRRQHLSGLVIVVVDRLLAEDDQLRPFLLDHRLQQLGDSQRLRVALALDEEDRKSVVEGKGVSVRVDLGGRRLIKQKKNIIIQRK